MREPYVSKPNYPLLLAVIAGHALAVAYALKPGMFGVVRDRIAPANAHAAIQAGGAPPTASPNARRATAQPEQVPADDPRQEFDVATWLANGERVARERTREAYGDTAAKLASDPAGALDALRTRYANGDDRANAMRFSIAWECSNGHTFYDDPQSAPPIERQLDGVAPADAPLLRGVHQAGRAHWQAIKPRCDAWDTQAEAWRAVTLKYREGKGPNAQFERLAQTFDAEALKEPSMLAKLLEAIKKLWAREPDDVLAHRLAEFMLALDDDASRERGLKLLVALAERDARYTEAVAAAYAKLDGRKPYDAQAADAWALRAAEAGSPAWIRQRADRDTAAGDTAAAWSWHAFALWLDANGCGVGPGTFGEADLAQSLRGIVQAGAGFDAATRAQAGTLYRERVAQHGAAARTARRCAAQ
jgi:hypothetical protein